MARLLLTGGAGFIGSQLVRTLVQDGWTVRVLDRLTYAGRREHLQGVDCELRIGDVCDPAAVVSAMEGCEAVVHAAAESHVGRSLEDPASFLRTNVEGTRVVLEAAVHAEIGRFMLLSTDEVFGEALDGRAFGPDDAHRPGNPYAASKVGAEALARAWQKTWSLPVSIVRCVNCYGPRQHPEKAVAWWARDALLGGPVPVQGVGSAVRDWLYVEDLARGMAQALRHPDREATWHFAGQQHRRNLEMARSLISLCARRSGRLAQLELVAERQGQDRRYALDDAQTRERLSWSPAIDLATGLEATVDWIAREGLSLWGHEGPFPWS